MSVEPLPGLGPAGRTIRPAGRAVVAAQAHVDQLRAAGLVGAEHELACAIVLELAERASDAKAYAAAQLYKELREAMAQLPSEAAGDAWAQLRDWLAAEANTDHPEDFAP